MTTVLKMLDLFCGTKSMAKAFERAGWETYTVDWGEQFEPTLCCDVNTLTVEKIIELCGGKPDFVHLSPDCSSYSMAAIFHLKPTDIWTNLPNPNFPCCKNGDSCHEKVLVEVVLAHKELRVLRKGRRYLVRCVII